MELTEKIRQRYDRIAVIYDAFEKPMEMMALKKYRIELANQLKGTVLEVGVGTGKNIEFYPDNIDITAIDFSSRMLAKARDKATNLNKNVNLHYMDVQSLSFPDNSFDYVFTTCVFCSVPDPVKGLAEIKRVCKPNGKIIMIEHVRSSKKMIGTLMDMLNPIIVNLYGANINRRTVDNLTLAGFTDVSVTNLVGDIVIKIEINNMK